MKRKECKETPDELNANLKEKIRKTWLKCVWFGFTSLRYVGSAWFNLTLMNGCNQCSLFISKLCTYIQFPTKTHSGNILVLVKLKFVFLYSKSHHL